MGTGRYGLAIALSCAELLISSPLRVKIATVDAEYRAPTSSYDQPVSIADHYFEVDPATGRTRIVVEYQYPFQSMDLWQTGALGPAETETEVPGLTWDGAARAVIYQSGRKKDVCAAVPPRSRKLKLKNVRSCRVVATTRQRLPSDGSSIQSSKVLDVWLEPHGN